ncbi:glutathione peroxidase-like [Centruroides sculpturatus]|uniref:glutathione peroxidase-like n=1 Tax=Centruroides sculpturatus TaxID=218467 RepID=UPI000C6C9CFE|nr:glutathione peroxidase-like [Centruroides sculpturatus]
MAVYGLGGLETGRASPSRDDGAAQAEQPAGLGRPWVGGHLNGGSVPAAGKAVTTRQQEGQNEPSEPENESYIKEFIKKYNIQFDMFSKIDVNGDDAHPLWKYLKFKQVLIYTFFFSSIKWNFTKFLVDKNGQPVARYPPNYQPLDIEPDILKYIEKSNL